VSLGKRIGRSPWLRAALCWLAACYIRLVWRSCRWQVLGSEIPARFWDQGKPFIVAFWHGRLLMMPVNWRRDKPVHILISQHRDGELISRTVAHFGVGTVRGSSRRGGARALRLMVKALQANEYVGITPDGPRGPRMRASEGLITVARLAQVPILPGTYAVSRRHVLGTWDGFVIAYPFSRGVVIWGEPISVPEAADAAALEAARLEVETALNRLTAEADALCGHPAMVPGDARA